MDEREHREISGAVVTHSDGFSQVFASLRLLGAERFDPVGLHSMEVLASRTGAQRPSVQRILEEKLARSLVDFEQRFQQARLDAKHAIDAVAPCEPGESLGDLTRFIERHSAGTVNGSSQDVVGQRTELKSVRQFRNTWSKLSANQQVARALNQGPKNAGPINSHMLVLRSLSLMRDISPDYLNRFVSYVDTLLCLDQRDREMLPKAKVASVGETGRKARTRRNPPR